MISSKLQVKTLQNKHESYKSVQEQGTHCWYTDLLPITHIHRFLMIGLRGTLTLVRHRHIYLTYTLILFLAFRLCLCGHRLLFSFLLPFALRSPSWLRDELARYMINNNIP